MLAFPHPQHDLQGRPTGQSSSVFSWHAFPEHPRSAARGKGFAKTTGLFASPLHRFVRPFVIEATGRVRTKAHHRHSSRRRTRRTQHTPTQRTGFHSLVAAEQMRSPRRQPRVSLSVMPAVPSGRKHMRGTSTSRRTIKTLYPRTPRHGDTELRNCLGLTLWDRFTPWANVTIQPAAAEKVWVQDGRHPPLGCNRLFCDLAAATTMRSAERRLQLSRARRRQARPLQRWHASALRRMARPQ